MNKDLGTESKIGIRSLTSKVDYLNLFTVLILVIQQLHRNGYRGLRLNLRAVHIIETDI